MNPKKVKLLAGAVLVSAALLAACKSAPPAAPEPTPSVEPAQPEPSVEPAPTKPVDESLTSLRDECEALRDKGLKYGLNTYKSEGWAEAETSRNAGLAAYGTDYDASEAAFKDAIQKYSNLFSSAFEEIALQLEDELIAARDQAISAGADSYFPEQFAIADEALNQAASLRDSGDKEGAYAAAQIALMRYRTLILGMDAVALNDEIVENDFAVKDPESYAKAGEKYEESAAAYGTRDPEAFDAAGECVKLLSAVSNAGYRGLSEEKTPKVLEIRDLCDSIKASRSMPVEYGTAQQSFDSSKSFGAKDEWKNAYNALLDAENRYTSVYQEVTLRRNAADFAISAAKNRQAASADLARQADELVPLPEDAEGFSDEPYVIESDSGEEIK